MGFAAFQQSFSDRDSRSSAEIRLGPILNNPTGLLEEEINLLPSPLFWSHGWARPVGSVAEKSPCVVGNHTRGGRNRIGYSTTIIEFVL